MRTADIYYNDKLAGYLAETIDGKFEFRYNDEYLLNPVSKSITLTMPLSKQPYTNNVLFPFFEGLIPEGWLLNIATTTWKINRNDRMGLLIACCENCIGAVSVLPNNNI